MPKQGMKRPDRTHTKQKNSLPPVPEIQGKAKSGKEKAKPLVEGDNTPPGKVFPQRPSVSDAPIPPIYGTIDTDLARDNMEIDLPRGDIQNF